MYMYLEELLIRPKYPSILSGRQENLGRGNVSKEKAIALHSSTLAWKIPWTEEPGRLQSMGSRRVGHNWVTSISLFTYMHWRREWQPIPVFLPGAWWAAVYGVAQSLTRLKWFSSSSSSSVPKARGNLAKVITKNSPQKMHYLGVLNQQTFSNVSAEVFGRFILRHSWWLSDPLSVWLSLQDLGSS